MTLLRYGGLLDFQKMTLLCMEGFYRWTKFRYKIGCSLLNKIDIITYFENLTVKFHVLYTLNTHVKFCVNQILFTI